MKFEERMIDGKVRVIASDANRVFVVFEVSKADLGATE